MRGVHSLVSLLELGQLSLPDPTIPRPVAQPNRQGTAYCVAMGTDVGATSANTLGWLVSALGRSMVELLVAPDGPDVLIHTQALVAADDYGFPLAQQERDADVVLLIGVRGGDAVKHLSRFSGARTRAIFVKSSDDVKSLELACESLKIALVGVNTDARWEHVHALVRHLLRDGLSRYSRTANEGEIFGTHNDLFGLSITIAALTGGLVTIDDPQKRVLAFSPLDESADEIRRVSILGRSAPASYKEMLRNDRVYERLRRSEIIDLRAGGRIRRRIAAGMLEPKSSGGEYLGTIWVQEGVEPLHREAKEILRMATQFAVRLIGQIQGIPNAEQASVLNLLGDPSARPTTNSADVLGLRPESSTTVVGFAVADEQGDGWLKSTHVRGLLALYSTSHYEGARVASIGERLYAVFPRVARTDGVVLWANKTVSAISNHVGRPIVGAVSDPGKGPDGVAKARKEVDSILDAAPFDETQVATINETRTLVILRAALRLMAGNKLLTDPRFQLLLDHDASQNSELVASLRAYLDEFGDIRTASEQLHIHPNTLRYRIRRAADVSGINLGDPDSRVLLQLQLRSDENSSRGW